MLGGKRGYILWAAGLVIIGVILIFGRPKNTPATTNTYDTTRSTYAVAYDGLWRQDSGQSPVLVTATIFPPFLQADLEHAASRTSEEDQMWSVMNGTPGTAVPVFVTFDSASGSIADATISGSLSLQADNGLTFHLDHWTPLVGNSHIVNASSGAASQIGVAMFTADQPINWSRPPQVTLMVKNIAGEATRTFVWTSAVLHAPSSN